MSADSFKTNLPTVAVIIPTHRRPQLLKRAVESVLKQDYPLITQIIITQDGDDPETAMVAEEFARLDKRVLHVRNEKHKRGPCGNKNNGLDFVEAEYVMFLDDDDYLLTSQAVSKMATYAANYDVVVANCIGSLSGINTGRSYGASGELTFEDWVCSRYAGEYTILFRYNENQAFYFHEDLPGFEHLMWWQLFRASKIWYLDEPVRIYNQEGERVTGQVLKESERVFQGYVRTVDMNGEHMNAQCPKILLKHLLLMTFYAKHANRASEAVRRILAYSKRYRRLLYLLPLLEYAVPNFLLRRVWLRFRSEKLPQHDH